MNPESGKKKKITSYNNFYDILRKYGYDFGDFLLAVLAVSYLVEYYSKNGRACILKLCNNFLGKPVFDFARFYKKHCSVAQWAENSCVYYHAKRRAVYDYIIAVFAADLNKVCHGFSFKKLCRVRRELAAYYKAKVFGVGLADYLVHVALPRKEVRKAEPGGLALYDAHKT